MLQLCFPLFRSSHPKVFLVKGLLKNCSKFTGEHPCRSVISIKLQSNFIEIALRHGCFLFICCTIAEHLFLGTPLVGCFCLFYRLGIYWATYAQCKPQYTMEQSFLFRYNISSLLKSRFNLSSITVSQFINPSPQLVIIS